MSYFRGLSATPDPWANTAEPSVLSQALDSVTSAIGKLVGGATAPATAPIAHPAPLTAAEQAKLLGTTPVVTTTLVGGGGSSSKLPLILGVGALAVVGFLVLRRPRANPARRRRHRRGRR